MNLMDDAHILLRQYWLQYHNPQVNWKGGTFTLDLNSSSHLGKWDKTLNKNDKLYIMDVQEYIKKWGNAWDIKKTKNSKKPHITFEYPE